MNETTVRDEETTNMSYEDGFIVGMFLGDGSYYNDNGVTFSLNSDTKSNCIKFLEEYCPKRFHAKLNYTPCVSQISGQPSCVNVSIISKYLRGLVEQFVKGDNALTKQINYKALSCSLDFRQGILDGLYATDGGNSNRIYTSSENLKDSLITMLASMGIASTTSADEREGRLGPNPCYTIRWYTPSGRSKRKDVYIIDDNYFWFKIKSITRITKGNVSYCLEMIDDGEPIFMLANGIHTHNCRLISDIKELG